MKRCWIWKGAAVAGTFKDKGLVIRDFPAGERDKRLTLLLFDRGRTTVFAKGAGNPKSKFHSCAQVFAFSEFLFFEGPGFLTISQCELTENFFGVRRDFERLCLASHVLEMADRMILPGMPCQNELRLIYMALTKLAVSDIPPRLAAAIFEFKFLQMEGFLGSPKDLPDVSLSSAAAYAISYILESDLKDIFLFTLSAGATKELWSALDLFRREILDSPPKSLELLN